MSSKFEHKLWDIIRPLHAPFTRALRRRLGRNYHAHPEMELPQPEESVQMDVQRHLHQYLHVSPADISQIVIVGASRAEEVEHLHRVYQHALILCFEPMPDTHRFLVEKYKNISWMTISGLALSDAPGKERFYELDMPGNGSLLKPDVEDWAKSVKWHDKSMTTFEVEVSTLDREAAKLPVIDLLWMDVQGAEGRVLAGAKETLKRTKSVFIEVALTRSPYAGAMLFPEIEAQLKSEGFICVALGVGSWNGGGNAFFVKDFGKLVCK